MANETRAQPYSRIRPARVCGHLTKAKRDYCKHCSPYRSVTVACAACGVAMRRSLSTVKKYRTCSPECASRYQSDRQRGVLSHLWRGGVAGENRAARYSVQADRWRLAVFERDDYTCALCGRRGGRLTADHLLPWSAYPELRFDVRNGRTVCRTCHYTLPTTGFAARVIAETLYALDVLTRDPRVYLVLAMARNPRLIPYYQPAAKQWAEWQPGQPIEWPTLEGEIP